MKKSVHLIFLLTAGLLTVNSAQAATATLRYGFRDGATYTVKQQYHNVGNSSVTMNMMGQERTMDTPVNHDSTSSWTTGVKHQGGKMILSTTYGKQQGGERWGDPSSGSGAKIYGKSSARATIDPLKGMVSISTKPAKDPIVDNIYRFRFAWMPQLPKKALKADWANVH